MSAPPPLSAPQVDDLRSQWSSRGAVRIDDALPPGLAAELVSLLPGFPLAPRWLAEHADQSWSCEIGVPAGHDSQHPAALVRLSRFLDRDLPALARQVTGRDLGPARPRLVHVWALRRGAYVDDGKPLAPPGGVDVVVGLTGARWPAAWGGHTEVGELVFAPGYGTVDLFDQRPFRVPLLTHDVEVLAVRAVLR